MQPATYPKFGGDLEDACPRCGDIYEAATDGERFQATGHRLLHMAGDWKRSLWPLTENDGRHNHPTAPRQLAK